MRYFGAFPEFRTFRTELLYFLKFRANLIVATGRLCAIAFVFGHLVVSWQQIFGFNYLLLASAVYCAYGILEFKGHRPKSHLLRYIIWGELTIVSLIFLLLSALGSPSAYALFVIPIVVSTRRRNRSLSIYVFAVSLIVVLIGATRLGSTYPASLLLLDTLPRLGILGIIYIYAHRIKEQKIELNEQVRQIQKASDRARGLQNAFFEAVQGADLQTRLEEVLRHVRFTLRSAGCMVYLRRRNDLYLAARIIDKRYLDRFPVLGFTLPIRNVNNCGVVVRAAFTKETQVEPKYADSQYCLTDMADIIDGIIACPLIDNYGNVFAVISVFENDSRRVYGERDARLLEELRPLFGFGILEQLRYEEIAQSERDQSLREQLNRALSFASAKINVSLEREAVLNAITEESFKIANLAQTPFNVTYGATTPSLESGVTLTCILLLDEHRRTASVVAAFPPHLLPSIQSTYGLAPLNGQPKGIMGAAFSEFEEYSEQGKLVRLQGRSQVYNDLTIPPINYLKFDDNTKSELAVPIRFGTNLLGILNLEHSKVNAFYPDLILALERLASMVAPSLSNVLQINALHSLVLASAKLHRGAGSAKMFANSFLQAMRDELITFDRGTFQHIDYDPNPNANRNRRVILGEFGYSNSEPDPILRRPPSLDPLITSIMESGKVTVFISPNTTKPPGWETYPSTQDIIVWVCIPLKDQSTSIPTSYGVITLDFTSTPKWNEREMHLTFELVGRYATILLQNIFLWTENTVQLEEAKSDHDSLIEIMSAYERQYKLAEIALIHGESMHYGQDQLSLASENLKAFMDKNKSKQASLRSSHLVKEALNNIQSYIDRLTEIYEKAAKLKPKRFSIRYLVEEVCKTKRRDYVTFDYSSVKNDMIGAPREQVKQVLLVIIDNALQAIKDASIEHGHIKFSTSKNRDKRGEYIKLRISDNGPGIPFEKQSTLFEHKGTFSIEKGRSGTGLPWAKGFMTFIRGDITLDTSISVGTTIEIKLYVTFGLLGVEIAKARRINKRNS